MKKMGEEGGLHMHIDIAYWSHLIATAYPFPYPILTMETNPLNFQKKIKNWS